ncbi:hypothetical protein ABZ942_35785 [Nocardia sp. NPDC046473]|uniref:hypothetical protein n=1 Tax=Nocardia sp. NPDC046473 TaxID=3155733 RepID=UPI0033EEDF04
MPSELPPATRGDRAFDALTVAVVTAMSAGLKDEAAARRLSVSLRTYRRYVAEVMTRLGVATRFQLGVRAAELGILAGTTSSPRVGEAMLTRV